LFPNVRRLLLRHLEWPLIIIAGCVKLWLTEARMLHALGWARYDDYWFIEKASTLLAGEWLGPYNEITLIKGAGYPLWIAFVSSLGMPLLLAQQVFYALACLAVSRALAPLLPSRAARVSLFIILLFNPMSFSDEIATRVSREGFYPALGLMVFAGVAGAMIRLDARRSELLRWLIPSGLAVALFWHTREEGVWILPMLGFAIVALVQWVARDRRSRWRRGMLALVVPGLIFLAAYGAIVLNNGLRYGIFAPVEFKEPSFVRAFSSLTHVRQHPSRRWIPVPKEVRERVYAVSPAFLELRPFLEGDLGASWAGQEPQFQGEIGGATFMWAFREAVAKAGYYRRGGAAVREYYSRLSREIDAARLTRRLDARSARASLLPPLLYGQRREVGWVWLLGLKRVVDFIDFGVRPAYSHGTQEELQFFRQMTRTRLAPSVQTAGEKPEVVTGEPQLGSSDASRFRILNRIGRVYQLAFLPLAVLAVALYAVHGRWILRSRTDWRVPMLIAGLLSAILARVLILSLIQVTSFGALSGPYQAPSHPLMLTAFVLIAHEAVMAVRWRWLGGRPGRQLPS
jgi:hypothetical protein